MPIYNIDLIEIRGLPKHTSLFDKTDAIVEVIAGKHKKCSRTLKNCGHGARIDESFQLDFEESACLFKVYDREKLKRDPELAFGSVTVPYEGWVKLCSAPHIHGHPELHVRITRES